VSLLALIPGQKVGPANPGNRRDRPGDSGAVNTIAILVEISFLIGIDRAWELIGEPSIGISQEVAALVRGHERGADKPSDEQSPP
jgi:hypothetical protein